MAGTRVVRIRLKTTWTTSGLWAWRNRGLAWKHCSWRHWEKAKLGKWKCFLCLENYCFIFYFLTSSVWGNVQCNSHLKFFQFPLPIWQVQLCCINLIVLLYTDSIKLFWLNFLVAFIWNNQYKRTSQLTSIIVLSEVRSNRYIIGYFQWIISDLYFYLLLDFFFTWFLIIT